MSLPIASLIGFAVGAIAVLILWSRSADRNADAQARRADAEYMRGYHRGASGKAPQLHQYDV